jgi:signal transduction histidine kinase
MSLRLTVRVAAPSIAISLVLLALGTVGGWYVQSLQKSTAALVALDTSTIRAAEQLLFGMNAIRSELTEYLVTGDRSHLDSVPQKCQPAEQSLAEAERLADDPKERALAKSIRDGFDRFKTAAQKLPMVADEKDRRTAVKRLIDDSLDQGVIAPAKELLILEEDLVRKSGDYNQGLGRWIAFFLFLVGVCGAVAGLVAGFGIARSVSRSIVELYLPIRAASGRLEEVVGPVDIAPAAGIDNLDAILRRMADHVGTVVDRLQQNQTNMLRNEQMAALGQLAAGLAHELRNPLTAMKMLVAGAAESGNAARLTCRDLTVLTTEIGRLERSIQTFLDFARPPKLETRCRDLREVVWQTLDLVAARGKQQSIRLQSDMPNRPVIVEADHEQLRQLLLNLVLNAMDAQPNGGAVLIGVSAPIAEEPADVASNGRRHASWITLTVADQGPGVAADMAERIFDPYFSTKETGLGMGLAICRRIAEDHGGEISADNSAAGGADFRLRLPTSGKQESSLCPSS